MGKEVTPFFKPVIDPCICGCGVEGRVAKKVHKGEMGPHVLGCKCRRCLGSRNRSSGLRAQRMAARSLGVAQLGPHLPSDEELFAGALRIEVKSGAQVRAMDTAFNKARAQSEAARAIGDVRPTVVVAKAQPASKDGIVAFRLSDIRAVSYALASNLGLLVE